MIVLFLDKLESAEQEHKKQLDALKCQHEEEIFTLKKEVYILNAKVLYFAVLFFLSFFFFCFPPPPLS
jgi:hypothetical protein